jgi:hypothetical protein
MVYSNFIIFKDMFDNADYDCLDYDQITMDTDSIDDCKVFCLQNPPCPNAVLREGVCYIKNWEYLSSSYCYKYKQATDYQSFSLREGI